MNKNHTLIGVAIFFFTIFLGSINTHAAYTNTGWDWQNIPEGPNGTSYGSINPNGGKYANSVDGIPVRIKAGTTPKTDFKYSPDNVSTDPWGKGNVELSWSATVTAKIGIWEAITNPGRGLGFVAHINLPKSIFAGDFQNALVNASEKPSIKIGNTDVALTSKNFVPIGPHTIRLTMTKNNIANISSQLASLVISGTDMSSLPIAFTVSVPITQISANGAWDTDTDTGYYTGVKHDLTYNKFPPMREQTDDYSVDFYGYDDINEGAASNGSGTGFFYAKLNSDNTFISKNRTYSQTPIKSWDKFISLWDNTNFYNTQKTLETVDGSNNGLGAFSLDSNGIRQNKLDLNIFNGTWSQINQVSPNRFDRVVDFFSMKSTPGIKLMHTPNTSPGIGKNISVLYSGNDNQGTPLTPVKLQVGESYLQSDIKVNNLTVFDNYINGQSATAVLPNSPFKVSISWKAPSLSKGRIVYRVLDSSLNTVVNESSFVDEISNNESTINSYQDASGVIKGLPDGTYLIQFKIIDEDYPTQNDYMTTNYSGVVATVNGPNFKASNTIKNMRTEEVSEDSVPALWGDTIQEKIKYSVVSIGNQNLKSSYLKIRIPNKTTFVSGSLKMDINGHPVDVSNVDYSVIGSGITINLPLTDFKVDDAINVSYDYQIGNISNQEIQSIPTVLGGKVTSKDSNGKDVDSNILSYYSNPMKIVIPSEMLQIVQFPSNFSYGIVNTPYQVTDIPIETKNFNFKINNTRVGITNSHWQINASMSKEFQTSDGHTLDSEGTNLVYDDTKSKHTITTNQATPIYAYDGTEKGNISVNLPGKLVFHIDPNKLKESIVTDSSYQCELKWELSNGPIN